MSDKKELTILEKLSAPLTKDDVELRVGSNSKNGFSMLLYKTARTDMKRLNEVCGMDWSNSHNVDNKNNVTCEISIFNKGEWVSREDTGAESFTEKEKGSYSDSFKRAGFRWGIGLELYESPFIWVNWDMKEFNGKWKPTKFFSSNLQVTKFEVKDGKPKLEIKYNKEVVFSSWKNQPKKVEPKKETKPVEPKFTYEELVVKIYNAKKVEQVNAVWNDWKHIPKEDNMYKMLSKLSGNKKLALDNPTLTVDLMDKLDEPTRNIIIEKADLDDSLPDNVEIKKTTGEVKEYSGFGVRV